MKVPCVLAVVAVGLLVRGGVAVAAERCTHTRLVEAAELLSAPPKAPTLVSERRSHSIHLEPCAVLVFSAAHSPYLTWDQEYDIEADEVRVDGEVIIRSYPNDFALPDGYDGVTGPRGVDQGYAGCNGGGCKGGLGVAGQDDGDGWDGLPGGKVRLAVGQLSGSGNLRIEMVGLK